MDLMKQREICIAKDTVIWTKHQPTDGKSFLLITHLIDHNYPKFIKNSKNQISGKQITQLKIDYRSKTEFLMEAQMAEKYLKKYSTSLATRKCKSK